MIVLPPGGSVNMASIWLSRPHQQAVSARVEVGHLAPQGRELAASQALRLVAFIRHVGCPFAENTVRQLRAWAEAHPQVAVFVVSHGDESATRAWLDQMGGAGRIRLVIDTRRGLHGQWGVGYSHLWHFAGPRSLLGVLALWPQGIRNRSAAGTRWQRSAMFLVNGERVVWAHTPRSAQEFELPPRTALSAPAAVGAP